MEAAAASLARGRGWKRRRISTLGATPAGSSDSASAGAAAVGRPRDSTTPPPLRQAVRRIRIAARSCRGRRGTRRCMASASRRIGRHGPKPRVGDRAAPRQRAGARGRSGDCGRAFREQAHAAGEPGHPRTSRVICALHGPNRRTAAWRSSAASTRSRSVADGGAACSGEPALGRSTARHVDAIQHGLSTPPAWRPRSQRCSDNARRRIPPARVRRATSCSAKGSSGRAGPHDDHGDRPERCRALRAERANPQLARKHRPLWGACPLAGHRRPPPPTSPAAEIVCCGARKDALPPRGPPRVQAPTD